jgi:hypothetical protein
VDDLAVIETALVTAFLGTREPVLSADEAKARAQIVSEDMIKVRFDLQLEYWKVELPNHGPIGVPAYKLIGSQFDPNAPLGTPDVYKAAGPGLNCGNLLRLSKACKLGRVILKKAWPNSFATRLRDPNDHLAVVEELLWLGYWQPVTDVQRSFKQSAASKKNIDWRFSCCGQLINLEVKYRRRDWVGIVDGPHFSRDFDSYFEDCEGKFGPQKNGELNIIGVSTLAPPDDGLRRTIERFLKKHPEVDGIILWSFHAPSGAPPEIHSAKADLLKLLFTGGDSEDRLRASPIRHLWRKSEERRTLRPGEFPEELLEEARRSASEREPSA